MTQIKPDPEWFGFQVAPSGVSHGYRTMDGPSLCGKAFRIPGYRRRTRACRICARIWENQYPHVNAAFR